MQTKEYFELRELLRMNIQQGNATVTEILENFDQAFYMGHHEGMRTVKTELGPEAFDAFCAALDKT